MSLIKENLKYSKDHEWILVEGECVTIGITDFAQSALGDIVFVELPEVGRTIEKGTAFGVVESIKSVSDLYAPVSGEVVESNTDLEASPESINESPYESWMIKIKLSNETDLSELLSSDVYQDVCNS
ncbi:MAG: glycine cleavage system protein GcvH [Bacteriovoracaceae bacterium]|jgi:glycine cleavage system H protein|nr:glycine cleavage system protein GcvH [Bacteriovoracaceae bacterium]